MICAISGEVPEEPVVSKRSGLIYERRLIEHHVANHGKCPVTNEELSMDDLVAVKTNKHDASGRVVTRLTKERDDARMLLSQTKRQIRAESANAADVYNGKRVAASENELGSVAKKVPPGINPSIIAEINECNALLFRQRRKRQIPATLVPVDALDGYTQVASHPLHKSNKPGILCIDIDASKDIIATGGVDSTGVVFNRTSGQILSTLSGHSKKITSVKFVPGEELVITGSGDKTVRIWQVTDDENYDCRHMLRDHTAEVQAVTLHATNKYFVTASMDNTWCFYDLSTGSCLTQVGEASSKEGYTSASFHPDGFLLGTGNTRAVVKIWDIKSQCNIADLYRHVGSVTAMSFSENGYFLATAAKDGVKLWDLRNLSVFKSFTPYDSNTPTNSVEFDFSGSYLAIAGSDTRVYQVANVMQEWNLIKTFPDLSGTGKVTSVKFGADASYMAVGSMDCNLWIFGSGIVSSMDRNLYFGDDDDSDEDWQGDSLMQIAYGYGSTVLTKEKFMPLGEWIKKFGDKSDVYRYDDNDEDCSKFTYKYHVETGEVEERRDKKLALSAKFDAQANGSDSSDGEDHNKK